MNIDLISMLGKKIPVLMALVFAISLAGLVTTQANEVGDEANAKLNLALFDRHNLVAWCIVPFDSQKRNPEQRASMLDSMKLKKLAYDYRAEHIPQFEEEIKTLKAHGIELTAWWFPTELNDEAKLILSLLERHQLKTQLWVTGSGSPTSNAEQQREQVKREANRIRPIALAAAKIGCAVGLYNHGGWFGEPENQLEIIEELGLPNVGIVYNQHHGHHQVDRFEKLLTKMTPKLLALNLNGMIPDGEAKGQKIVPIGGGEHDLDLLRIIAKSDYKGPIGILNHTDLDAEARLLDNLDGLEWLVAKLKGDKDLPRPVYRSWKEPNTAPLKNALGGGKLLKGKPGLQQTPLTAECDAVIDNPEPFNILIACETKQHARHWELFTQAGTGKLALYLPGRTPDHVVSDLSVSDGKLHRLAVTYNVDRVRLYVDGRLAADSAIREPESQGASAKSSDDQEANIALGRLVEGGIQCLGEIYAAEISRGNRALTPINKPIAESSNSLGFWQFNAIPQELADSLSVRESERSGIRKVAAAVQQTSAEPQPYDPQLVQSLIEEAGKFGAAQRGLGLFSTAKSACFSCHKIGSQGGSVGPELTELSKKRSASQIVESLLWPNREVDKAFQVTTVLNADGEVIRGYKVRETEDLLVLKDPSNGIEHELPVEEVQDQQTGGSLMPEGLVNGLSRQQQLDLIRFMLDLGKFQETSLSRIESILASSMTHEPADFPLVRDPIEPALWPHWQDFVNRDRVYDFYSKQASHFRRMDAIPPLLVEYHGLDGGKYGHWGNQKEETWASRSWNDTILGSVQSGVYHGPDGVVVPRGVCVQLLPAGALNVCFNPDTLTCDALWKDGFLEFSSVRHGFMHGLLPKGKLLEKPKNADLSSQRTYRGFYRSGERVVFSYLIDGIEYLDSPYSENGEFLREVKPASEHSLHAVKSGGKPNWPQWIETEIKLGKDRPYVVDTIELPWDNPWKSLMFIGDHAFMPDGSAVLTTMQGDVWRVEGISATSGNDNRSWPTRARWRRIAAGLHQPLGIVVNGEAIFVLGRDQITRLHDLNGDLEIDFYECFSNRFETSTAGHDFICGLQQDAAGNFYTASGNQGIVRISADDKQADVIATGFRNPDGLGLYPDGTITVPCSEGEWTPTSMICAVRPTQPAHGSVAASYDTKNPPFFGYRGPRGTEMPSLPMVYLPRGVDNSSGGQSFVDSDRWGPAKGLMVHTSFGTGSHFLLLRDEVNGQIQGAVVPMPGEFNSGTHRAKFSPVDGQLYVSGMGGWGTYTPSNGCFQRVRYTGAPVILPTGFHLHENGIAIKFSESLNPDVTSQLSNFFAQAWNYRYSAAYGSAEYSSRHVGVRGHDVLAVQSAHLLDGNRTLFLEIPELPPVNQIHLQLHVAEGRPVDMFLTSHALDKPRTDYPGFQPTPKSETPHPMLLDLALATRRIPNPWRNEISGSRVVEMEAGKNLSFVTKTFRAKAGEAIALKFINPDVVPHNWALVKPGKLKTVGEQSNRLVADPEAAAYQYVPQTDDVVCYTDIVDPKQSSTIYFQAPSEPGRYPFLCTFPGHWMVMNGEMVVEEK